jgi:hypothetical protein
MLFFSFIENSSSKLGYFRNELKGLAALFRSCYTTANRKPTHLADAVFFIY